MSVDQAMQQRQRKSFFSTQFASLAEPRQQQEIITCCCCATDD
jgi:hypothetical protein